MAIIGLQSSIWQNRARSTYLILGFPVVLFVVIYLVFFVLSANNYELSYASQEALNLTMQSSILVGPIIILRGLISFWFHKKIIFAFSGAKNLDRKDNPEIYNIVENLCISRGLFVPKIGILEDDSMNAFALGRNAKNARVVFSRGLLNRLDKTEIEAVAAHELTHIINKDTLVMTVIIVFVGIIGTLGEILVRFGGRSDKEGKSVIFIGFALLIVGYIFFPFMRLALSRKREFLADAGSVELTKDNNAMIRALQKISSDAQIESIKKDSVAAMCIDSPFEKPVKPSRRSNLRSTHPSIAARIKALEKYG